MIRILVACVLALVISCEKEGSYELCPMTCKQKWDCNVYPAECGECRLASGEPCPEQPCGTGLECYPSCLVVDHPQCADGPCMLYQAREPGGSLYRSEPFCSSPCSSDADCGAGARCRDVPAAETSCKKDSDCQGPWNRCVENKCLHKFCVPDSYVVKVK